MPRLLRDADRMERGWQQLVEMLSGHGMVIVHGDEHLGNLGMEPDGTPIFYDFLARGEPWPLGLVRFLIPTLDTLAYRAAAICPLMIWLNNSSSWQPEATNTANAARSAVAVLDHDSFGLLGL